jgi:hypothetical protein
MPREQVTILRRGASPGSDPYGVPLPGTQTSETVDALAVAPRSSGEYNRFQATVTVGLSVYLPAGTNVDPKDRMIVRGVTYEVVGEPADWRNPFTGSTPGIEVALERAG